MNKGLTTKWKVTGRKCVMKIKKKRKRLPFKTILFLMTGMTFEECYRRTNKQMKMKLTTMKLHETKVLLVE